MNQADSIFDKLKHLPEKPGVYQFYNDSGDMLYIGKAKNLKKRVSSYFRKSNSQSYKHGVLVRKIRDINYVLVENESDALLLENNLIKEYQPRYNVLLKDDKTFPWICIKKERFPRVQSTRNTIQDGSEYFGPYTSGIMVKTILELIRQLYKLRTCNFVLSAENIEKKKYSRCLEYHLGNCKAPCEDLQTEEEYNLTIDQIREILRGNYNEVILYLRQMMKKLASNYQFEAAEIVRLKLEALEKFKSKSTIVSPRISNVDVFSMIDEEHFAYVNFLKVVNGAVVQAHNVEVVKRTVEVKEDLLAYVIFELRERFSSSAKEIVVPFPLKLNLKHPVISVPVRGEKKKLLELSERNAASYRKDKITGREEGEKPRPGEYYLTALMNDLKLKALPQVIECFDNSNLQGSHAVSACVVFRNGKPSKSDYRHYNIKTVTGPNDFASMEEVLWRRYRRTLDENKPLPDLIIIDGGKGQLHAAQLSLQKLGIDGKIAIIGIAKRLEEIYMPGDQVPLYLDKNSPALRLIQRLRDEAHRFGITFHRKKRSDTMLGSSLDNIKGIGEVSREKILKSVQDISALPDMSLEELTRLAGKRVAGIIFEHFNQIKRSSQH